MEEGKEGKGEIPLRHRSETYILVSFSAQSQITQAYPPPGDRQWSLKADMASISQPGACDDNTRQLKTSVTGCFRGFHKAGQHHYVLLLSHQGHSFSKHTQADLVGLHFI